MNPETPVLTPPATMLFSDADICKEIAARLQQAAELDSRQVAVQVQGCLVTLSGTTSDAHTRRGIQELAENCPGVQDVQNHIQVRSI